MTVAIISHPDCLLHEMGEFNPEQPARIQVIQHALQNAKFQKELKNYLAPLATREQLELAHTPQYVEHIFKIAPARGLVSIDPDTAMNSHTLTAALRSAGAVVAAVDLVMAGEANAAFCNVRPPGHHAEKSQAMGFCFFNNIVVGVLHALEKYQLNRVAIVDFDVHHGNGTEDILRNDDRVLFCSSFQHPFYPYSGAETESSHIINIPLAPGTNGEIFREKVEEYWLGPLKKFAPEMIFISAGFDAHENDVLANLSLTASDYAWITKNVKEIANQVCHGRIVSVLEGGYAIEVLGECAAAHVNELI